MNIESLRYFSEVAMLKSISKVADKSHISQPALSNQLSKLELELGVKLFERSNKGVNLTEYGEMLFRFSKDILNYHGNLIEEIESKKNKNKEIKIAITNSELNMIFAKHCAKISKVFEDYNINIDSSCKKNEQAYLINNNFDVIIRKNLINDKDLHSKILGSDKFIIVSRKNINKNKIKDYPVVLYDDEQITESIINKGIFKNIKLKTNSFNIIKAYLKEQDVIAFLPKLIIEKELIDGELIEVDYDDFDFTYDFYISYKKDIDINIKNKIKKLIEIIEVKFNYDL
ncbi:LysR family transcriptional regulator [Clostridium massiliamazoniense]|uniref:LysR family transcriptional regulator n=1 Tax=Clostridium massiliamazoniense TaxID=1347366 RepID=UPI0006D80D59|nr:LysR family transcriptional regulator [Clostridium massiliamazoniense]